ncbi:MAG: cytochrome b [Gammaproteobacteria bacterium]|nr:cytochrome b [Gammaproteobacteria bacterium]
MLRDTQDSYGLVTKLLHAVIFLIILGQITLGITMNYVSESTAGQIIFWHKSFGLLLLFVAVIFILWRLRNPKPHWPLDMPMWERIAARIVHYGLYILMVAMPLSGWIMSTAAGYPSSFFGWFAISTPWIEPSKALAGTMSNLHTLFAWGLGGLAAIHFLAAMKHRFIDKDTILQRMF